MKNKLLLFLSLMLITLSNAWGQEKTYELITDISQLESGENYLIVNRNTEGSGFALGKQNNNNRASSGISVHDVSGIKTITTTIIISVR